MKKLIFLIAFAVVTLSCRAGNNISITGSLESLPDGTRVTLTLGATHKKLEPVAETTFLNGAFSIQYKIEEPRVFYVRFYEPVEGKFQGQLAVLLAPGDKVTVEGTLDDRLVTGSATHDLFIERFLKPRAELDKLYRETVGKFSGISKQMGAARASGDKDAVARVQASEEWVAYEKASGESRERFNEMINKQATENSDTYWGPMLVLANTAYLTQEDEKYYNMFSEEARNSFYGKLFAEEVFGISGMAPDFSAKDENGAEHTLKELLSDGHYVLIDFWASWCGPCRRFVPTIKDLAVKYSDKGLVVVSISIDTDNNAWLKAVEEEQMPWLNLLDESGINKTYGVSSIPSIYLVDPHGKILFGKQSGQNVVDKLSEILGN